MSWLGRLRLLWHTCCRLSGANFAPNHYLNREVGGGLMCILTRLMVPHSPSRYRIAFAHVHY